jgi:hypothetical protein
VAADQPVTAWTAWQRGVKVISRRPADAPAYFPAFQRADPLAQPSVLRGQVILA